MYESDDSKENTHSNLKLNKMNISLRDIFLYIEPTSKKRRLSIRRVYGFFSNFISRF